MFDRTASGRRDLNAALAIFARNTSPLIRTQINQIQEKFETPESATGRFYYAGFYANDCIVGFNMFAYYPRSRVIIVDHMALEPEHRRHGSFYIFASLLQQWILTNIPDVSYVVTEVGVDPAFDHGDITGSLLVRLLRQVGFGRVHVKYYLPNNEPKIYQKKFEAALMLRGLNRVPQVRAEDLIDIVKVILFEHDLTWYQDYFGDFLPRYKAHLSEILADIQRQVEHEPTIEVNGDAYDELGGPAPIAKSVLGLPFSALGHSVLFVVMLAAVTLASWFLGLGQGVMAFTLIVVLAYAGLAALSEARALNVFDRLGKVTIDLVERLKPTSGKKRIHYRQTRRSLVSKSKDDPAS
ncbi:MAG: hypothetical protein WDN01_02970 [Rhizomicrobium sp.]